MDQKKNLYNDECPMLHTLNIISRKWRLPIIWSLSHGSLRYNELKRELSGITNIMLTRSLQDLEELGLVKRIPHKELTPHVEYVLTDHATHLVPAIQAIQEWGEEHLLLEKDMADGLTESDV